jgi:hypothetical protein
MEPSLMSNAMLEGIAIGGVGGFIAGLTIWLVQLLKEKVTERNDKNRVYTWLYKRTKQHRGLTVGAPNDLRWISTIEIASCTNLTPDRVCYICSIHEKIRPKIKKDVWRGESLEEKWGIREFVDS